MHTNEELAHKTTLDRFPKSAKYDPVWQIENSMGPNALWLTEFVTDHLDINLGDKVLDLGPGKGLSSVFLTREFDCEVWAADLWIDANDNKARFEEQGLGDRIHAVDAEAHSLPFGEDFFDFIVSFDSYHYYGTDELYAGYLSKFLKRGGKLATASPGLVNEFNGEVPEHLVPGWEWDMWTFHTPEWWEKHIDLTRKMQVETTGLIPDGWKYWVKWDEICDEYLGRDGSEAAWVTNDAGRNLGFVWWIASRPVDPEQERWH